MSKVTNYMEIWVKEYMPEVIQTMGGCTCEDCQDDIFALALNNLKPCYVVTTTGHAMARSHMMSLQFKADILREVSKAAVIVHQNPRHT